MSLQLTPAVTGCTLNTWVLTWQHSPLFCGWQLSLWDQARHRTTCCSLRTIWKCITESTELKLDTVHFAQPGCLSTRRDWSSRGKLLKSRLLESPYTHIGKRFSTPQSKSRSWFWYTWSWTFSAKSSWTRTKLKNSLAVRMLKNFDLQHLATRIYTTCSFSTLNLRMCPKECFKSPAKCTGNCIQLCCLSTSHLERCGAFKVRISCARYRLLVLHVSQGIPWWHQLSKCFSTGELQPTVNGTNRLAKDKVPGAKKLRSQVCTHTTMTTCFALEVVELFPQSYSKSYSNSYICKSYSNSYSQSYSKTYSSRYLQELFQELFLQEVSKSTLKSLSKNILEEFFFSSSSCSYQ